MLRTQITPLPDNVYSLSCALRVVVVGLQLYISLHVFLKDPCKLLSPISISSMLSKQAIYVSHLQLGLTDFQAWIKLFHILGCILYASLFHYF